MNIELKRKLCNIANGIIVFAMAVIVLWFVVFVVQSTFKLNVFAERTSEFFLSIIFAAIGIIITAAFVSVSLNMSIIADAQMKEIRPGGTPSVNKWVAPSLAFGILVVMVLLLLGDHLSRSQQKSHSVTESKDLLDNYAVSVDSLASSLFDTSTALAQTDSLRARIDRIIGAAKGNIGVAIQHLEMMDTLALNDNGKYPMQSVFKFPLALAVLSQVDKGKFSLNQQVYVKKSDLWPNTWSPLREKYPDGNINIRLDELLRYTVSESDNNGCDILFRLLGGTNVVDQFVHNLGIKNIAITATEEEMAKEWEVQYRNWSSPSAMGHLLSMFYQGKILSRKSRNYLMQLLVKTSTGPGRLKGLLPEGTIVAHKTGSSGTNKIGITAATNDVGVITLPNDRHVVVVVFVSNSTADEKARDKVIASIAKIVWDVYSVQ